MTARVRLIHWRAAEAAPLRKALRQAGYQVDYDEDLQGAGFGAIRESPPDAFVIDLSRLPSHGREVAVFFRGRKSTRQVPIVFVGGQTEKVAAIRKLLPDAIYAQAKGVESAVRRAFAVRSAAPLVPPQMMQRYTARTAAQKLGIAAGTMVAMIDPPRDYAKVVGDVPEGAALEEMPEFARPITLWFVRDAAALRMALPAMRTVASRSKLWILWRKGGEVSQRFLRESAGSVGLVDYKICAVDKTWSAMLFARRKQQPGD